MTSETDSFELCGETLAKLSFPNLYNMYQISPENAAAQLKSIADAWHNGSIGGAAVAFESDMSHL